ncbi:HAD family hydrolase [Paenibacillus glufosinatiresistens]|uniref:HAD family hydrolase n=1 Tax=Paenibacillus glufosinatiresistens TaxID=3070657 RepID=UPI00286DA27E|nr:hypothetical protein [Paenibacillus sp. YX.27]
MYSFDVFDTLITRATATPKGIFALMQEKLRYESEFADIPEYVRSNFFLLRSHAEQMVWTIRESEWIEEITLIQIYDALLTTGSLTAEMALRLQQLERAIEYEYTLPIQSRIEWLKTLIRQGERVILISDMYLDHELIQAMLVKADPILADLPLYISSDYGQAKWTGKLYKRVAELERVEFSEWTHCGDNLEVDIQRAAELGIRTKHLPFSPLTTYEQAALERSEDDAYTQLSIGASRYVRVSEQTAETAKTAAAIGSSLGGPILFSYVWWLLEESCDKGISRLYFIARDGYVLKGIADRIIRERQLDIKTHYLYGSRQAWRMASFGPGNDDLYRFIGWSYSQNLQSVAGLADILQLSFDELEPFLPFAARTVKKPLSQIALAEIAKRLNSNLTFKTFLQNKHRPKRELVARYLQQELDLTNNQFAFVDLSGGGFTQSCLAVIMKDFYPETIRTFYLRMDRMKTSGSCIYYNFLPSYLGPSGLLVEMLCRAMHGQTIGYREEGERIVPVLNDAGEVDALSKHGFVDYVTGVENFTSRLAHTIEQFGHRGDRLDIAVSYLKYAADTPDNNIRDFFGKMPNGVTGRESEPVEFAPILTRRQLRQLFLYRTDEPIERYYSGSYLDYSIMRANLADKRRIAFYRRQNEAWLGRLNRFLKTWRSGKRYRLASYFPVEALDERIVLYGAGKMGQEIRDKILKFGKSQVVLWADRDYLKYRQMGMNVSSPDEISQIKYDSIVIGVKDRGLAGIIRRDLADRGLPEDSIRWVEPWPTWE